MRTFLDGLSGSLRAGAHVWIAPWNKPGAGREDYTETVDRVVSEWASTHGIIVEIPPDTVYPRYGIGYQIPTVAVWKR